MIKKEFEFIKKTLSRIILDTTLTPFKISKITGLEPRTVKGILKDEYRNLNNTTLKKILVIKELKPIERNKIEGMTAIKNKSSKTKEYNFNEINNILEENKKMKEQLEDMKRLNKIFNEKVDIKDSVKERAFQSDMSTTSLIINRMWKLNNESSAIFSELELLLEINNVKENKKMKKGLSKVSKNLIDMAEKIMSYCDSSEGEIIDID